MAKACGGATAIAVAVAVVLAVSGVGGGGAGGGAGGGVGGGVGFWWCGVLVVWWGCRCRGAGGGVVRVSVLASVLVLVRA